jgi:hypothetical protein
MYVKVTAHIAQTSMLYDLSQDFEGLRQCAANGPNEDKTPSLEHTDYYRWFAWKKHTMSLWQEQSWDPSQFREAAMRHYIRKSHQYLQRLALLPPIAMKT